MKPSWLVPVLAGGGAAASFDKVGIISDKIAEVKVLLKGVTYQRQPEGASIQSPSANAVTVDLDTLNIALPNRTTKPKLTIQRDANSDQHDEALPVITLRTTTNNNKAPPDTRDSSAQQTEPPPPSDYDYDDPDVDKASSSAAETGNPASANRAIAGMGVGLVSVMLIFTVFL